MRTVITALAVLLIFGCGRELLMRDKETVRLDVTPPFYEPVTLRCPGDKLTDRVTLSFWGNGHPKELRAECGRLSE